MLSAAIIGAAGYAGAELTRLLLGHPVFDLVAVTSGRDKGRRVSELYPGLAECDLVYGPHDAMVVARVAEVVFLAVPHTAAMAVAPALLEAGCTVVDASADFRLRDPAVYAAWYQAEHSAPELLPEAVYGLPELWRESLPGARLVACPGCYPTATLLAAARPSGPGSSSPGGSSSMRSRVSRGRGGVFPRRRTSMNAADSVAAYKVMSHRHTPEIAQALGDLGLDAPMVVFTPHLGPLGRGLLSTVYLECDAGVSPEAVHSIYRQAYEGEPFVTVCDPGVQPPRVTYGAATGRTSAWRSMRRLAHSW